MKTKYIYFGVAALAVAVAVYPVVYAQVASQSNTPYFCAPLVPCQQPAPGKIVCISMCVITMKNSAFLPGTINASVGAKIVWVNDDGFSHTSTAFNSSAWTSPIIPPGRSYTLIVNGSLSPGKYYYYCRFHPFMVGVLIIMPAKNSSALVTG